MSERIFLGKSGRAFGPYSKQELEQLTASGAISGFNWIWNEATREWRPLDPPPAPLKEEKAIRHDAEVPLEAILHNRRWAIRGRLSSVAQGGCEFHCSSSARPQFTDGGRVLLNVFDPATNRSSEISALLKSCCRGAKGQWKLVIQWTKCPELVLDTIAA